MIFIFLGAFIGIGALVYLAKNPQPVIKEKIDNDQPIDTKNSSVLQQNLDSEYKRSQNPYDPTNMDEATRKQMVEAAKARKEKIFSNLDSKTRSEVEGFFQKQAQEYSKNMKQIQTGEKKIQDFQSADTACFNFLIFVSLVAFLYGVLVYEFDYPNPINFLNDLHTSMKNEL